MGLNSLRDQLLRDEGCRLKVYTDLVGKLTIGVGRNLEDKGISLAEAEMMLDNDIRDFTADVLVAIPWAVGLDEVRREALVNMAFNMGTQGLLGFKRALAALHRGDWATASEHMLESKWASQVGMRAERLAAQVRSGVRQ